VTYLVGAKMMTLEEIEKEDEFFGKTMRINGESERIKSVGGIFHETTNLHYIIAE